MLNREQRPYSEENAPVQEPIDLVLELQQWCFRSSPAPMYLASIVFALAIVGGIAARAYNISGSGLALYHLLIARSGTGKGTIQTCMARLFAEVSKQVPSIYDFKGMGHIASGPGIIRWLSEKAYPLAITIIDEIGEDLAEMTKPNNLTAKSKQQVLLQLFALSGANGVFDPMAYSDAKNNTKPLRSPNLTLVGMTVPNKANAAINDEIADSGFLARCNYVEHHGDIPPEAADWKQNLDGLPSPIVNAVANLTAEALTLAQQGVVRDVAIDPDASAHFNAYGETIRLARNAVPDAASETLNRNKLKSMIIAAILAVGQDREKPRVTLKEAQWATGFVEQHSAALVAKIRSGHVGEEGGNEAKQLTHVVRVISDYSHSEYEAFSKYGGSYEMHRDGVITEAHIQRRLFGIAAFKGDKKVGPSNAIKRALKMLLEADELREMPPAQMQERYGNKPRAFVVSQPGRFRRASNV